MQGKAEISDRDRSTRTSRSPQDLRLRRLPEGRGPDRGGGFFSGGRTRPLPDVSGLKHCNVVLEMLTLNITENFVDSTAKHLSGSAGTRGTDAVHLQ